MTNGFFRPSTPDGLPYELELIATRRRWMMTLFGVTVLIWLAVWLMHSIGMDEQTLRVAMTAGAMGAAATWVLMVMLAQSLYGWMIAIMAGAAGLFIPVMTVLGVIVLNYQAVDRLNSPPEDDKNV